MLPLGPQLGEWCAALHREHGVDLRLGTGVAALHGAGRIEAVELTDGTRVGADLVVVGMGAQPNTEWLAGSGLRVNPGLECDASLTAVGDPDILGAGDIVSWPHPLAGGDAIRIEHWTVAAEQGQQAGRNVLLEAEQRKPYDQPPYFWSDQYDTKIQSLGLPGRATRLELLEQTADGSRFVYGGERDGRLVGVIAINAARRLGAYRMALADPPGLEDLRTGLAVDAKALGVPPASGVIAGAR
jgi:3-phenylpropionate/trans-cinnamate dioxygenase ferredoxin reductase subunit